MGLFSIQIPQLGEGLREAIIVEFLKRPGDSVHRDEPIYVMETDKATTEIESPVDGTLVEWSAVPGSVVAVGSEIGKIEVADGNTTLAGSSAERFNQKNDGYEFSSYSNGVDGNSFNRGAKVRIPPKTLRYLKRNGLLEAVSQIPAKGKKLTPEDVDRYIGKLRNNSEQSDSFQFVNLSPRQTRLNYRLTRGVNMYVPATVVTQVCWETISDARNRTQSRLGLTTFRMACWVIVQVAKRHDKFRSVLSDDGRSLKVFKRVNLGVAVGLPHDELVLAVVHGADEMSESEFYIALSESIEKALEGEDQGDDSVSLTVSSLGKTGMILGIPAVVSPGVATLSIGAAYEYPVPFGEGFKFQRTVSMALTFDHRIVNGIGAANFMNDIKVGIEAFDPRAGI